MSIHHGSLTPRHSGNSLALGQGPRPLPLDTVEELPYSVVLSSGFSVGSNVLNQEFVGKFIIVMMQNVSFDVLINCLIPRIINSDVIV